VLAARVGRRLSTCSVRAAAGCARFPEQAADSTRRQAQAQEVSKTLQEAGGAAAGARLVDDQRVKERPALHEAEQVAAGGRQRAGDYLSAAHGRRALRALGALQLLAANAHLRPGRRASFARPGPPRSLQAAGCMY
jgi:hypothetical protein